MPNKQQIGRCGELLVQYKLLLQGVESASLTTDAGIDLVAYSPRAKTPLSIQVNANLQPKSAGGKGKLALNWWLPDHSPADLVALVDLSTERIWLLRTAELMQIAQQHSRRGYQLYMWVDPTVVSRKGYARVLDADFEEYLLDRRIEEIFGIEPSLRA